MKEIEELIEYQRKRLKISKTDLAKNMGVSRMGLYRLFDDPEKLKLKQVVKLCEILKLDIQKVIEISTFDSKTSTERIDIIRHDLNLNDNQIAFRLGIPPNKVEETIQNKSLNFSQIQRFSELSSIPLSFLLKREENIKQYLKHQKEFEYAKILKDFYNSLPVFQIEICNQINSCLEKTTSIESHEDNEYIEYIEEAGIEIGLTLANFHIAILKEGNKKPIVIISNLPTQIIYTEHFVESIFTKVRNRFLQNYELNEIVWICNTYLNRKIENRHTSAVKLSQTGSSADTEFFQLYDYRNKQFEINKDELKKFLK